MATLGNYSAALGGMAKDAVVGGAKSLVTGLKGAIISEAPGLAGAYAFGKDLSKRANSQSSSPKMAGGNTPLTFPSQSSSGVSSPLGGLSQAVSLVAGQNKSNVINLEQVRQLKQLNDSVINQSKLISFGVEDTKRKNIFAEEVANEQAIRDDKLLDAINKLSDKFDAASFGGKNKADGEGGGGLVGAAGSVAAAVAGGFLKDGLKWIGTSIVGAIAAGWLFFKRQIAAFALTAALRFGGGAALGGAVASAGARSAIMGTLGTVIPMVLRFLTGPIGLGIMAAAGIGAYLYSKRDPEKAAAASANSALKKLKNQPPETEGQFSKVKITQDEAKVLLEQRAEREKVAAAAEAKADEIEKSATATKQQKETARKFAEGRREAVDYDIKPYGGLSRVQRVAAGEPDPGGAINSGKFLDKVRSAESGGRNIPNPLGGTAGGVYQITDSTWTGNVQKMIDSGDKRFTKADLDPNMKYNEAKARMVAEYITEQNRVGLKNALGKDPTETDLYMAYFLGMGGNNSGAIKFLKEMEKDPAQLAWKLSSTSADSDIINNNAEIFFDKVSRDPKTKKVLSKEGPRSVKAVYELMNKKISGAGGGNAAVVASKAKPAAPAAVTAKPPPGTKAEIDNSSVTGFYKDAVKFKDLKDSPPLEPLPVIAKLGGGGFGGAGGDNDSLYTLSSKGSGSPGIKAPTKVIDDANLAVSKALTRGLGIDPKSGALLPAKKAQEVATQTKVLKPLFKSNTDIIRDANTQFIKSFRATATNAFTQILTKTLFPKGVGVDRSVAGRDDMYRGQQLQKIFGTDAKINSMASKLLGKQYGPMFAPMFNQLAQGYLEVGSRIAGKAIFQGIGGLGAEETQGITGQVLGNLAAGNKKLALEQLLYGASGGKESGIALGAETMFAKYGFKNPMEGISYFANVLGEAATSPLNSMMNNNPQASVVFDPRLGYNVYQDGPNRGQRAGPQAGQAYGQNFGGGQLFSPGLNNYGVQPNPYGTTAMAGAPGSYITNGTGVAGKLPTQAEFFGQTQQQFANNSKETLALQQAQLDLTKANNIEQARKDAEKIKQAAELSNKQIQVSIDASRDASAVAELQAQQAANLTQAQTSADALITKAQTGELISGLGGRAGSGTGIVQKDANGNVINPNGKGNLFSNETGLGQFGNFAGDMLKNAAGQKIVQSMGIKNPYMQMVANFGIQKLLGKGFDMVAGSDFVKNLFSSPLGSVEESLGGSFLDTAGSWISDGFSWLFGADGGRVTGPGTGRSDSIPAMLSNGEFVVNAAATKTYGPLLDSINAKKYADGTPSTPGSTKALSTALGTKETHTQLAASNETLTSIDGSLRIISGQGTSSGTMLSSGGSGSYSYSGGLGGVWNPAGSSSPKRSGVNAGRPGPPSTMDIVGSIAEGVVKSYLIKTGIGIAANAIAPGIAYEMTVANLAAGGGVPGFLAGAEAGASMLGTAVVEGVSSAVAATGFVEAGSLLMAGELSAALAAIGPAGWVVLGVVAVASFLGYGGGGSSPPPKESKFHAAIYVSGNNDISAIAPVYQTTDYHAPPDAYKTIAYGLLRVAFNAAKAAEQVTKMTPPFDYLYIKVEFNRISLCWGKGAPDANTLATSDANQAGSWGAPTPETNLNSIAKDIVDLITAEFKKIAGADAKKLDTAAKGLLSYGLNDLSSDLISDLKTGDFKLDTKVGKGIFSNNVAESNRISALINAASSKAPTSGEDGIPLVWSMKDNAYVENLNPGAVLYDAQGRPVYDIPGTSSGITSADFGGTDIVGIDRPANLYSPTTGTVTSGAGAGGTVISAPSSTKIDNSSVANFYNPPPTAVDGIRNRPPG